jgi:hypothetical protein
VALSQKGFTALMFFLMGTEETPLRALWGRRKHPSTPVFARGHFPAPPSPVPIRLPTAAPGDGGSSNKLNVKKPPSPPSPLCKVFTSPPPVVKIMIALFVVIGDN